MATEPNKFKHNWKLEEMKLKRRIKKRYKIIEEKNLEKIFFYVFKI